MRALQPSERITTQDQATKKVEEYVERAAHARDRCNVEVPGDREATVKAQQKAYQHWLMHYGAAVGTLTVLREAGLISDNAFAWLQPKVYATLAASVMGDVSSSKPLIMASR